MDEIVPGLWVGGLRAALDSDYLCQAGITHIITCMKQRLPPPRKLADGRMITENEMKQVRLDDDEKAPILVHFSSCNDFIAEQLQEEWLPDAAEEADPTGQESSTDSPASSEQKVAGDVDLLVQGRQKRDGKWGSWQTTGSGTVLVHCQAGCSRSVAIVAAYLMFTRHISAQDAVDMIKLRRKDAQPNAGFMAQLELYDQVGYEIDMRHQAVRRFLMSKTDILNGDSMDDMLLSYYPSPYPSPALSSAMKGLTSISNDETFSTSENFTKPAPHQANHARSRSRSSTSSSTTSSSPAHATSASPSVRQLGFRLAEMNPSTSQDVRSDTDLVKSTIDQSSEVKVTANSGRLPGGVTNIRGHEGLNNRGSLPKPTFTGPKLRCKSCRRELAAYDHVVIHEPGKGQMAFEHRKRDAGHEGQSMAQSSSGSLPPRELKVPQMFGASRSSSIANPDPDLETDAPQASSEQPETAPASSSSQSMTAHTQGVEEQPTSQDLSSMQTDAGQPSTVPSIEPNASSRRPIQSAASLASRLPPHLAALRGGSAATKSPSPISMQSSPQTTHPQSRPSSNSMLHSSQCSSYFIEPMAWMTALSEGEVTGRLNCPNKKCEQKLGSWDWAGMQCGCGAWVTPAFALHRSKVDEI